MEASMLRGRKAPKTVGAVLIMVTITMLAGLVNASDAHAQRVRNGGRAECPDHAFTIPNLAGPTPAGPQWIEIQAALAGPITNVPEFHDCQRFLTGGRKPGYGPLVAIFASFKLDSIPQRNVETSLKSSGYSAYRVAAAEVYSYDGDYDPLGIHMGFNCLYMAVDTSTQTWHARMQAVPKDTNCLG